MESDGNTRDIAAVSSVHHPDLESLGKYVADHPPEPTESEAELADRLYVEWYLDLRAASPRTGPPSAAELDLVRVCEAAHPASGRFESGWQAVRVSTTGRVVATCAAETRLLSLGDYVDVDRPGRRAEPGDRLAVTARRSAVEDGFWVTRSAGWEPRPDLLMTRIYLHARLDTVGEVVARLGAVLDDRPAAYALKVFLGLDTTQRRDAVVVYLPRGAFESARMALADGVAGLTRDDLLEAEPPRLTARLARGVGAADGAGDGSSFGASRCGLLAAALLRRRRATRAPTEITHLATAALGAAGLDPARPYLDPAADWDYLPFG